MPILFDARTGEPVEVADDQVVEALDKGVAGFKPGNPVTLVSPSGVLRSLQPDDPNIFRALDVGFKVEDPEVGRKRVVEAQFGDQDLQAFGEGAARALSFGVSDFVLPATGLTTAEEIRGRREANFAAAGLGELTGAGLGLVTKGPLQLLGAAPKAAVALGRVAESATSRALAASASPLARALEGTVRGAAGGIAEGVVFGAGEAITRLALSDAEDTTEHMLSALGTGALLGGIGGAALPAIGGVIRSSGRGAKQLAQALGDTPGKPAPGGLPETVERVTAAEEKRPGFLEILFKDFGTEEGALRRRRVLDAGDPEVRDQIATGIQKDAQALLDASEAASKVQFQAVKPAQIKELLKDVPMEPAADDALSVLGKMDRELRAMRADPAIFTGTSDLTKLERILESTLEKTGQAKSTAELFRIMDKTKGLIDKQVGRFGKQIPDDKLDTILRIRNEIRTPLKRHLQNANVYGEQATRQTALNTAFSEFATARKEFVRRFGEKITTKTGAVKHRISSVKFNTWLNQAGAARGKIRQEALDEFIEASEAFAKQADLSANIVGIDNPTVTSALELAGKLAGQRDTAIRTLSEIAKVRALDNGLAFLELSRSGVIPGMNALAGAATFAAGSRIALRSISAIEGVVVKSKERILRAARAATRTAKGGEKPARRAKSIVTGKQAADRAAEIRDIAADQDGFINRMQRLTEDIADVQPALQRAMIVKSGQVLTFLNEKAPQKPLADQTLTPLAAPFLPPASALQSFSRYLEAVDDPISVIEDLAAGDMNVEGVETLQTLYPRIYQSAQQEILEQLATSRKEISYPDRVKLFLFFGIPTDATLTPEFMMQLQESATVEATPEVTQRRGGDIRTTGLTGIDQFTEGRETATQRIEGGIDGQ